MSQKDLIKVLGLIFVFVALIAISALPILAASDTTSTSNGASYTRWVGPWRRSTSVFVTGGNVPAAGFVCKVQFKDPLFAHDLLTQRLYSNKTWNAQADANSSSAYHRAYVGYGSVTITV